MKMKKHLFFFCALYFCVLYFSSACLAQISMAVGSFKHSVISNSNGVCGWGMNGTGEIGDGSAPTNHPTPVSVTVPGGGTVTKVVAGHTTTIFLKSNGTVWGCGYNELGQL